MRDPYLYPYIKSRLSYVYYYFHQCVFVFEALFKHDKETLLG